MVHLLSAIPVSYAHGLQSGRVSNKDHKYDTEAYHPLMGLWADTLAYQLSSVTSLSGSTQKKDDVPDNQGFKKREAGLLPVVDLLKDCKEDKDFIANIEQHLDLVKNLNIAAWLKDNPNLVDPDTPSSPRARKSPHAAACAHSVASVQHSSVATSSASPDGRVA